MNALVLLVTLWGAAWAQDLAPWAGVPLVDLPVIGLGTPTLTEGEDAWQAPLGDGGFVRFWWHPDEDAAKAAFAFQARAAVTVTLPAYDGVGDEAVGDGTGLLIVRSRNVVVLVRDPGDQAAKVATGLLAELEPDGPGTRAATGTRDRFGRLGR